MFQFRRSCFRLITSKPSLFLSKPRSFATLVPSLPRQQYKPTLIAFQQRWASSEAEVKNFQVEELPVTAEEPTPEEQVEATIHADNASQQPDRFSSRVGAVADSINSNESSAAESDADSEWDASSSSSSNSSYYSGGSGLSARTASGALIEPKSTIYIGNLFFDVTEGDLEKELSRFGRITKCRLIRDPRGLSKGFGYVDFETIASATKAIETLHQQLFEGRRLAVQYAAYSTRHIDVAGGVRRPERPRNPPSQTLFIGNMSFEMTDRDLNALFRGIRNVIDVRVAIDRRTGQPRGFAHADFLDVKSATEAMKALETKETYGRKLRLDYSYSLNTSPTNQLRADPESFEAAEEREEVN